MGDIKRIEALGDLFHEMKVATTHEGNFIYVTMVFPSEWLLDDGTLEKYNVNCEKENGYTYFWADFSVGFDKIFDAIEYNVKVNKEAQEKVVLFNEKIQELKIIFSDEANTLEKLRTLTFNFPEKTSILPFAPEKKGKGNKAGKLQEVDE